MIVIAAVLAACSSDRDAEPVGPRPPPPSSTTAASTTSSAPDESGATTVPTGSAVTPSTPAVPTSVTPTVVHGVAVAGTLGEAEASGPPFSQTDPFSEAVRLADGTCVGWADSRGGSTAGLAVGAPIVLLEVEENREIGHGTIDASRWSDVSGGGQQWNCFFDFTATVTSVTTVPAEFRVKVGALEPWLAKADPTAPTTFVASVSTDASIGLIPGCPAVPSPSTTTPGSTSTTVPAVTASTAPPQLVSGWNAVGQYWSRGVAALCAAGLPVTAIARPCRPPNVGSEYIAEVVDSADPTVSYANGAAVPIGTAVSVKVATGHPCG